MGSATGVRVAYIGESVHGTTPGTPALKVFRALTRNINVKRDPIESKENSATRQQTDVRHGFNRVEGTIGAELGMESFNDWLLWGLAGVAWFTPATGTNASAFTLTASGGSATITRTSGSFNFIDSGYRRGDWITLALFTNPVNNGDFRVTVVTQSTITVFSPTLTFITEGSPSATATVTYIGKKVIMSTGSLKTMTLEREMIDIDPAGTIDLYQAFRGVGIQKLAFNGRPEQMVGVDFTLLGMSGVIDSIASIDDGSGYDAAPTNSPFAAIDGQVYFGGSQLNITAYDFTIDNQRTLLPWIGAKTSQDIYEGVAKCAGTMTVMLQNINHVTRFQNETVTDHLQFRWNELGTPNFMAGTFCRLKWMAADVDPNQNGPVLQQIPFVALEDSYVGSSVTSKEVFQIQRSTTT